MITVPIAKVVRKIGSLLPPELALVEESVRLWLGL